MHVALALNETECCIDDVFWGLFHLPLCKVRKLLCQFLREDILFQAFFVLAYLHVISKGELSHAACAILAGNFKEALFVFIMNVKLHFLISRRWTSHNSVPNVDVYF
jgi:hypothetical protein